MSFVINFLILFDKLTALINALIESVAESGEYARLGSESVKSGSPPDSPNK